jgi:type II secretory pathway pseudopilin PulG
MRNRGFSLIELIFAIGLGMAVMAVGYRSYVGVQRMQEIEDRRESMMLNVQNAMSQVKRDIRGASTITATGGSLVIDSGRIKYHSNPAGIDRVTAKGRYTLRGVHAEFKESPRAAPGAGVVVRAEDTVRGRPISIEVTSYISPRNR